MTRLKILLLIICSVLISGVMAYKDYSQWNPLYFVIEMESSANGASQLYFNTGHGFRRQDSSGLRVTHRGFQKYLFRVPTSIESIRFDPINKPSILSIRNAGIENAVGDKLKLFLAQSFRAAKHINKMDVNEGVLTIHTAEDANDPILLIDNSSFEDKSRWIDHLTERGWIYIGYALLIFAILMGLGMCRHLITYSSNYRKKKLIAVVTSCILCFIYYLANNDSWDRFSDTAFFGGDTWEYQSMAVNWASGHGLRFGAIEDFSKYRFYNGQDKNYYKRFVEIGKKGGVYNHYRTPGYPLFVGVIYKFFDVSPRSVKQIQLIMIAIVCSLLPAVGFVTWGIYGLLAGIYSSYISFYIYAPLSNRILTEPLVIFVLFLFLVSMLYWQKRISIHASLILGLVVAVGLLVKGAMIFLPCMIFPYMYIYLKKRRLPVFKYLSTSILGFFIVVSGWSITATSQAGTFILLSTQGSRVLMDGNNEYSFKSGGAWSPQWDSDPDSYYNDPVVKDKSVLYKVTIFAMKHINQYPGLIRDKINTGFSGHLAIWIKLFTLFLAFDIITWVLMRGKYKPPSIKMAALSLLCLSVFLLYYFGVSVWFYILISLILGTYKSLSHDKRVECFVHSAPMVILFLNYLLLTVVIFGHPRFTVVIFAFVAIYPAAYGLFLLDKLGRFLFHNYRLVRLGNH